jgi:autotransporter-associated beta strand protein
VDLNNLDATLGALTGSRNLALGNAAITIGNNGTSTTYNGIMSGNGSLAKTGSGTLTLAAANSYSGPTAVNGGTLAITAATLATNAITFTANSALGLVIGSPVTASNAAVNFTNGTVAVSGSPGAPSHVLLTAFSFTGTPVLASPVPGYALAVVGNELQLNQATTNPYDLWKTQITNGQDGRTQDADADGFNNLQEFLFGTSPIVGNGSLVTTTASANNLVLQWLQRETAATYTLKQSTSLATGSWTSVLSPIPAPDPDQSGVPANYDRHKVTLPTTHEKMFFRIEGVEN